MIIGDQNMVLFSTSPIYCSCLHGNILIHEHHEFSSWCLQLLEIYWNLKTLLEIMEISWNLIGPPGNFCVRCRRSTALVSSRI